MTVNSAESQPHGWQSSGAVATRAPWTDGGGPGDAFGSRGMGEAVHVSTGAQRIPSLPSWLPEPRHLRQTLRTGFPARICRKKCPLPLPGVENARGARSPVMFLVHGKGMWDFPEALGCVSIGL